MKKIFVLFSILAVVCCLTFIGTPRVYAQTNCDPQDPDSPCFAPGELGDDPNNPGCDIYNPDSPCFAPGEKADTPAPTNYATPTSTPKSTKTATPTAQSSYPSENDILDLTRDGDTGGVGLLGALFLSPIVGMIVSLVGFLIFVGVVILVIVLLTRRGKNTPATPPAKSEKENQPQEK